MKILIIGFAKIKYMPYLNLYLENIDREKNDVHLIYWNRDLKEEATSHLQNITRHEFLCCQQDDASKFSKIGSFLKFRGFARKVLKEKFDFIVVLHSLPGVLLSRELITKYKNRYIFDYRDFTYESFKPYKAVIHSLVNNSYKTFVSSDAFRRFLPADEKGKILTSHNTVSEEKSIEESEAFRECEKIRISYWGFIREEKLNTRIIEKFGNDDRFELHYYGREQRIAKKLKQYAYENGFKNVFFHGEYNPEDRYEFIKSTDLIHNIFTDKNMMYAMSNKYYDGVKFKIPQLLTEGSFMAENAEKSGIGLAVDPYSEDFTQKIYDFYKNSDRNVFIENCQKEQHRVSEENHKIINVISAIG